MDDKRDQILRLLAHVDRQAAKWNSIRPLRSLRFGLRSLFIAMTLVAILLAIGVAIREFRRKEAHKYMVRHLAGWLVEAELDLAVQKFFLGHHLERVIAEHESRPAGETLSDGAHKNVQDQLKRRGRDLERRLGFQQRRVREYEQSLASLREDERRLVLEQIKTKKAQPWLRPPSPPTERHLRYLAKRVAELERKLED